MKTKPKRFKASWKSEKAEKKFRTADAARWKRATSTPPETINVATSFGPTRAYRWAGEGADIVLIHGMGDTSIRWVPVAESLAEYNVYAVDIMGDVGGSIPKDGFESAADYGTWLSETIAALGLSNPHIVGYSMGGYIALSHAVQGGPAASTVLFDPVGAVKLRTVRFIAWGAATGLAGFAPGPIRRRAAKRLDQPLLNDREDFRVHMLGMRGHPMQLPPLPVFTDGQLASIKRPLRLVVGAKTSAFDGAEMVRGVAKLVPGSHARLLAGAGHGWVMSRPDECLREIRAAVAQSDVEQPAANHADL